jgi:hypothetical protein
MGSKMDREINHQAHSSTSRASFFHAGSGRIGRCRSVSDTHCRGMGMGLTEIDRRRLLLAGALRDSLSGPYLAATAAQNWR